MIEDQYYPSYLNEQTSNSTVNIGCDFNKYDPFVEKIRTLFVPSLEPRIYSCLETFVYREDQETLSEPPYLKRCLDVAATWREPVYAFSTKLGQPGFLEKMLTQAVKYLIKDGVIDCFLNSIILNNRLNKICRKLDAAGVEKDFLRYLAVWNYINEKDYWIENDSTASTSMLSPSYDSIENYSDLDVQVGSGLDSERTKRRYKQASKRLAVNSSEFVCNTVNDFPENRCSPQFRSRLNINSQNPEGSKSRWIRKKPRPINQTCPCRPSNCPNYRTKTSQQSDWEGKTLKLRVCKIPSNCPTNFDPGQAKPCRLSRLPLPCKFDDMIADIFKADQSVSKLSSITTSKKLRANVTDICRCINETLGTMSIEEVKRCRFHCEILPGSVTFKLVQKEPNGCQTCLFSDRIVTNKNDRQLTPRGAQFSQKFENIEEENIDISDISIIKSTRVDLADENLRLVSSFPIETKSKTEPQVTNSINLPETELDDTNHQNPNEFVGQESSNKLSENHVNDQSCGCSPSFLNGSENSKHEEEGNTGTNRVEVSESVADRNNSVESLEKAPLVQSSGNAIEDGSCYCNNSDNNKLEIFNRGSEKTQDTDCVDSIKVTETENLGKKMIPEDSLNHLSRNEADDQTCRCSDSFPYTFSNDRESEKNQDNNCVEGLETPIKDFEASNYEECCQDACSIIPDYQKMNNTNEEKAGEIGRVIDSVENVQPVFTNQSTLSNSTPEVKSQNGAAKKIQGDRIRCCECPDSCECQNKRIDEHEVEKCDSQCSCDTCELLEKTTSLNRDRNVTRISSLVNSQQPSKTDSLVSNLTRPIIKESQNFGTANVKLQPKCLKSETNRKNLHHPNNCQDSSTKSKFSLPSTITKIPFLGTEIEKTWRPRTSLKSVKPVKEKLPNSVIKETRKLSLARSPIRIDTGRASSSRSQRINISIELCSESQSSGDKSFKNEPSIMLPVCANGSIRSGVQDFPSMLRPRCHSADARISKKQAILKSEKNTKDECLRHLRGINACLHSPPRPLESRDYLPPLEPPPRMGNPIMYGMSSKCERQSMRQQKRRTNGLKYSRNNENNRCCNKFQKNEQIEKPDELSRQFTPATMKPRNVSSSVIHNNICHAFSASSVDRMKHLIKTKLRRILLERDKATNTPKTSLANEKYRVSVPNGKTKRLPFPRQRCHTIWETRSASASTHTSKTFGSNNQSFAKVSEGDEIKTLFNSTTNAKIVSLDHKDLGACQDFDKTACYCSKSSNQSIVSSQIMDQRLVGGCDAPCQKRNDHELRYLWKKRQERVQKITSKEVQYVYNHSHCNDGFSSNSTNHGFTEDSIAQDVSSKLSRLCNGADYEKQVTLNVRQDEIMKCPGKLDWSGNSTSRHIYLYEYDNFESSNDGEANKWCEPKTCSPKCNSLPICKQGRRKKDSRKTQKSHKKNSRQTNSRSHKKHFAREASIPRNIHASSFVSSKIHAKSNIKSQKGFGKLDQDLRTKLLQYVSLCKNVKYSLLKMLRPDDVYDVRRLSIPPTNRYKFGDS